MKKGYFDSFDLIIFYIIAFGILLISQPLFAWSGKASFTLSEVSLLLIAILFIIIRRLNIIQVFRWKSFSMSSVVYLVALTVGSVILLDELDRLFSMVIPMPIDVQEMIFSNLRANNWVEYFWMFTGAVIAAPVIEESLYRGMLQNSIESHKSAPSAILITSVVFAFMHLQPWWIIQLFIFSIFMGYIAWTFDSSVPCIIIHAGNNLRMFIAINNKSYNGKTLPLNDHINLFWIVLAIILVVFSIMKLKRYQAK